jgi:hypothetical protein
MRRRFKADPKWITVRRLARCAEPNCQTQIEPGEHSFYYPGDKSLYGSRCGHGERAERDFGPHTGSTKTATQHKRKDVRRLLSCQSTRQPWSAI